MSNMGAGESDCDSERVSVDTTTDPVVEDVDQDEKTSHVV